MKRVLVKDEKELVLSTTKELIDKGIYAFEILEEGTGYLLLYVNAFKGNNGLSRGLYVNTKEWEKFNEENPDLWNVFENMNPREYEKSRLEQLTEEEYENLNN